jgi:hypothetical protein
MECPKCGKQMEEGWLAIYEPLPVTRVVWQPVEPGQVRVKKPEGAVRVIKPKAGGKGCPTGHICKACEMTVFSYAESDVT